MGDARLSLAWGKAPRRRSAPFSPKAAPRRNHTFGTLWKPYTP